MNIEEVISWNIPQAIDWLLSQPGLGLALLVILAIWGIVKVIFMVLYLIVLANDMNR